MKTLAVAEDVYQALVEAGLVRQTMSVGPLLEPAVVERVRVTEPPADPTPDPDEPALRQPTLDVLTPPVAAPDERERLFHLFWETYPRKQGKGDARAYWTRKKFNQATLDAIQTAVAWQRQTADWTKDDGQFIPLPATYLRQERWLDARPAKAHNSLPDAPVNVMMEAHRQARAGCPHTPPCVGYVGCRTKLAVALARAVQG